jgi:hypothetical protein
MSDGPSGETLKFWLAPKVKASQKPPCLSLPGGSPPAVAQRPHGLLGCLRGCEEAVDRTALITDWSNRVGSTGPRVTPEMVPGPGKPLKTMKN